jgi:serine/threonine-protein kinase
MAPSKSSADLDRGRRVGKYEIITRLSMGGMAELYLAFLPGPGGFKKFVALKQILPDVRADDSFVKMFLDEARITAAFNHANIGQVFDLGDERGELYLAMEFIPGQNLEQVIKRAAKRELPIPIGFAARVVRDVCLGLHYAHHFTDPTGQPMAVVHRDVSPKNVMITWQGQVKVIDFGIAKAKGRLNRTQIGIVKGTSGYMSPEQVKNEQLDGRTDLFAAAVMLHELLVGERLFTAPTDAMMMLKIVEGEVPPPTQANPYVTEELSRVVMKGLEKRRELRFGTGREFARAIEQAVPDLFEDEQVAEFMAQLFEDKIAITRSLLEAANAGDDQASVKRAAAGFASEEKEPEAKPPKKTGSHQARSSATPHPRPGVKAGASAARLPKVTKDRAGPSSRHLPQVGKGQGSRSTPAEGEEETVRPGARSPFGGKPQPKEDLDATLPPTRGKSAMKLEPVPPRPEPVKAEAQVPPPPAKQGGLGGVIAAVAVLAVLGGIAWAAFAGPLRPKVDELLAAEPVPVDTGPTKIDPTAARPSSDKPAWLLEKEKQEAELAAERQRLREAEAAANDPERLRLLAELEAQLKQLDYLEAEQRALKLAAQHGQAVGSANTAKIDDLQKQIDELKAQVASTRKRTAPKAGAAKAPEGEGEVQVVKDVRSAKAGGIGYLTLRTINPSSANVLLDGAALGSTPFEKVPVEVGVHRLRVIDGDGKARLLSVTIEAGKTNEMRGVDVGSLPPAP